MHATVHLPPPVPSPSSSSFGPHRHQRPRRIQPSATPSSWTLFSSPRYPPVIVVLVVAVVVAHVDRTRVQNVNCSPLSLSPPLPPVSLVFFASFPLCFSRSDPALRLPPPPLPSDGRRRPGPNSFPIYDRRKRLGGTGFRVSGTKMVENGSFRRIRAARWIREGFLEVS